MPSSSVAVASSLLFPQSEMSPAPTKTTPDPGGGAAVTVTAAVPLLPSLVAVIVVGPTATPLTRPSITVATDGALLHQVMTRPVSTLPLASCGVAVSCTLAPTWTEAVDGVTVTEATGTGVAATTVMLDVPLSPSLVAEIVAGPTATPVTEPLLVFTMATPVLLLDQVMTRPVRM